MRESGTRTWFQSSEAYDFFASLPALFRPFAIAVECVSGKGKTLRGVCIGYVTMERNPLKQFFARRAATVNDKKGAKRSFFVLNPYILRQNIQNMQAYLFFFR